MHSTLILLDCGTGNYDIGNNAGFLVSPPRPQTNPTLSEIAFDFEVSLVILMCLGHDRSASLLMARISLRARTRAAAKGGWYPPPHVLRDEDN